jgi:hypothetical protein
MRLAMTGGGQEIHLPTCHVIAQAGEQVLWVEASRPTCLFCLKSSGRCPACGRKALVMGDRYAHADGSEDCQATSVIEPPMAQWAGFDFVGPPSGF